MCTKGLYACTIVSVAFLLLILVACPAQGQIHPPPPPVHQFFHVSGTCTDGPVLAQAEIAVGDGTVTIVLSNLLPNERSIGQAISDFGFTVAGGIVTSASVTSNMTGTAESILSPSSNTNLGTVSTDRWQVTQISGNTIEISDLTGGKPKYLIAGIPDSKGNYPNANASMVVHSPVFVQSATITLAITGVTSSSTINSVTFSFGTGPDCTLAGQPGPVIPPH
jgi:hypothetical protein